MTYKSLQDIPITKEIVLAEAEHKLFKAFETRRIRTAWQLRRFVAGIPGALGQALRKSETYAVLSILIGGTWVPRSWA